MSKAVFEQIKEGLEEALGKIKRETACGEFDGVGLKLFVPESAVEDYKKQFPGVDVMPTRSISVK